MVTWQKLSLTEQAQEILKIAEKHGVEAELLFITTFKRYQVQIQIANDLEKQIKRMVCLLQKEYVRGRENVYSHPAISDYNRTTDSANKTVSTLIKIIMALRNDTSEDAEDDPLLKILRGESCINNKAYKYAQKCSSGKYHLAPQICEKNNVQTL